MKPFERFAHAGVIHYLESIRDSFSRGSDFLFGSSGEGELTIKGSEHTAYVRKYRNRDGWRVALCRGSVQEELQTFDSTDEVREYLRRKLR
jgi:hypothetical protein